MFSSEYCKIFKNTYFEGHLRAVASSYTKFCKSTKSFRVLNNISAVAL